MKLRKRLFSKPFDLAHSIMYNNFPSQYVKVIGVPGKFVKMVNTRVHLKNGSDGEMDSAYIADPDFIELHERVGVCLEHLSKPLGQPKKDKLGDYDIQLVCDEQLPTLIVIASHIIPEKSKRILKRSPSDITEIYFLDLGEENIRKRLNTVRKKIKSNEHLSEKMH